MTYLLDTSALLAHALAQPGGAQVQALLDDDANEFLLSPLSYFELAGVLKLHGAERNIPALWSAYGACARTVVVDELLAQAAWRLRESLPDRLPLADAIIAASARAGGATLVHRDRHLAALPDSVVPQVRLA